MLHCFRLFAPALIQKMQFIGGHQNKLSGIERNTVTYADLHK